jgi:hypothetical protein
MSVADLIIMIVRILIAPMVALLPTSISWFPIESWSTFLNDIVGNVIDSLSGLGFIFPVVLILSLVLLIISAEFILFSFKSLKWLIQLWRGGGGG